VSVASASVRPAPELGARAATDHVRGLVQLGDHMVVLLDIDRLIGAELIGVGADATAASAAA
jgi:chemotaxis signal transduction protein